MRTFKLQIKDFPFMKSSKKTRKTSASKGKQNKSIAEHRKERKWAIGILLLLTFLVYIPSLQNGFVNWDDNTYVYENESFINMDMGAVLTEPMAHNYHPITMFSLAVNYIISGDEPFAYHLTNLILHLLNTLFVFWLLYEMTKRNIVIAFIAALIFGIHPMHVESVAWVSERKDLLYTLFFLPALLSFIRYIKTKQAGFYALTLILFTLSLLSKPAAVIFPIVLFAFDWWYRRNWTMQLVIEKIPFLIFAFIIGLYTIHIQNDLEAISDIERYSFINRILFAFYGFNLYLFKFFIPYPCLPFYAHPIVEKGLPVIYWLSPLITMGILAAVFKFWRRSKVMLFGLLFYTLNLLLVLQLVTVGGAVAAERYTYVPYIGLALILAYWWKKWNTQFHSRQNLLKGGLALWLFLLAANTFQYSQVWKNGETLWSYQVEQKPTSAKGLINKGVYFIEGFKKNRADRSLIDKALQNFNEALKHHPNDINALNERAGVYFELQDIEGGFKDINKLIQLDPSFERAYLNRAILYSITQDHASAKKDYTRYLKSKPNSHTAYNWRGISYLQLQNYDKAMADFNKAIEINPQAGEYYFNRAKVHAVSGNETQKQQDIQKAKQLGFAVPQ